MDIRIEENEETTHISFLGNATVEGAMEIRDALMETLQKSNSIVLDAAGIKKTDVSFLQLLISAEKTAQESDKSIEIDPSSYSEVLMKAAVQGGFCREEEYESSSSMHSILTTYYTKVTRGAENG